MLSKDIEYAYNQASAYFDRIGEISEKNTKKVLDAFQRNRVAESMFGGSTGYGYSDNGREALEAVYAEAFGAEDAIVRLGFVNGTHAIGCAVFAGLKSGDTILSATGPVYDTLQTMMGVRGNSNGALCDYGISYKEAELTPEGTPDIKRIINEIKCDKSIKKIFIQRSRGYSDKKKTLSCHEIGELISAVKAVKADIIITVDNCYGEFVEEIEPCDVGADLIAGSLIKNPGGSLAPTGGYIAGNRELVAAAASRFTVPGIGKECGATLGLNRLLFQGFFMAPHMVGEAVKTAVFCAALMQRLGFKASPEFSEKRYDIIQTIKFDNSEQLIAFCNGIQSASPVDSFLSVEPWEMPGYDCKVIMAAGTFVQGASIELSCDAPIRPPYTAYLQGGITFESGKICISRAAESVLSEIKRHK